MSVSNLTAVQIKDAKEAFRLFDRDNDGKIESTVLAQTIRSLGLSPTNAAVEEIIAELNLEDGLIDFATFLVILAKRMEVQDTQEDIIRAFAVFDKEKSGFVSTSDLRHFLVSIGETLTDAEADEMMRAADPQSSGQIDYQRFVQTMLVAQ